MSLLSWLNKRKPEPSSAEKEMSFFDHLEELRKHLFRMAFALMLMSVVLFIFRSPVMKAVFFSPLDGNWISNRLLCMLSSDFCFEKLNIEMQALSPGEQFMKAMVYSFFGALIVTMPYLIWELWRFIKPGLKSKEVRAVNTNVFWMSLLFFIGVAFGYYVVLPFSIYFFSSFELVEGGLIQNNWKIGEYISFIMTLMLGSGLLFQLPVIMYYLARIGLVSSAFLKKYRRHSIVIILIVAGVFTPPDPLSQTFLAIPMYALYEISISVAKRVEKAKEAKEKAELEARTA